MASSLALWLEQDKPNSGSVEVELHFNYWCIKPVVKGCLRKRRLDEVHYLDVGIFFSQICAGQKLKVYFPFRVSEDNYISNLGRLVCERRELLEAVFNSDVHRESENGHVSKIKLVSDGRVIYFLKDISVVEGSGVSISPFGSGSVICFGGDALQIPQDGGAKVAEDSANVTADMGAHQAVSPDGMVGYVRFRLVLDDFDRKALLTSHIPGDKLFFSRVDSTEIIDFRVNEARSLTNEINHKLELSKLIIDKVHFFVIKDIESDLVLSHADVSRCRLLENKIWQEYIDCGHERGMPVESQMLIYHWKEVGKARERVKGGQDPVTDCRKDMVGSGVGLVKYSAFAKFRVVRITIFSQAVFATFLVGLGVVSGLLANWIYTLFSAGAVGSNSMPLDEWLMFARLMTGSA